MTRHTAYQQLYLPGKKTVKRNIPEEKSEDKKNNGYSTSDVGNFWIKFKFSEYFVEKQT